MGLRNCWSVSGTSSHMQLQPLPVIYLPLENSHSGVTALETGIILQLCQRTLIMHIITFRHGDNKHNKFTESVEKVMSQ